MALPELSRGRHSSTILSSFAFVGCGAREANCSANGNRWMNKRDSGLVTCTYWRVGRFFAWSHAYICDEWTPLVSQ